ncbi:MAG: hypothetical protein B6I26_04145 [Desulfobacteraceae bacterium 4572_130]|nr:MAG: hypothetical protein B6I26_04145 [Desulfobacteraceae bacterium 4572_130]
MNSLIEILKLKKHGVISLIGAGGKTTLMFRLARELGCLNKKILTTTTTKIFKPMPHQSPKTIISNSLEEIINKSKNILKKIPCFTLGAKHLPLGKLKGLHPNLINQLWKSSIFDWIIIEADGASQKSLKACNSKEPVVPSVTTHLISMTGLDIMGKKLNEKSVLRSNLFSSISGLPINADITSHSIAKVLIHDIKKIKCLKNNLIKHIFLNKADHNNQKFAQQIVKILKKDNNINIIDQILIGSLKNKNPVKQFYDINKG